MDKNKIRRWEDAEFRRFEQGVVGIEVESEKVMSRRRRNAIQGKSIAGTQQVGRSRMG